MEPRHRAHQAQSQPVAGRRAAAFEPDETVEHRLAPVRRDAGSAVGDLDPGRLIRAADLQRDSARGRVFERIVEQIGDRLRQQMRSPRTFTGCGASKLSTRPFSSATGS